MVRRSAWVVLLAFAAIAGACRSRENDASIEPYDLAITGATLIDGTAAPPRPETTILVRDGRIAAVVPDLEAEVPPEVKRIDATGKFLIPGLADMHVHFGTGGLLPSDSQTVDRVLRQFLFYGVTTVLNVGATNGGVDEILELRRRRAEGELQAPTIYATGGLLTVPGSHPIATIMHVPEGADAATYDWSQRGVWVVRTPAEVREVVARLAAAGMDGIKVVIESGPGPFGDDHPRMQLEMVEAAVEEARRHRLPVFAHATSPDELEDGVEAGVRAFMHLVGREPVDPGLLAAMREQGIYETPTLSLFVWADAWGDPAEALTDPFLRSGVEQRVLESLLTSPLAPTDDPTEEDWALRRAMLQALKAARDAGVTIVAGTDTNNPFVFPGYSMHHELELMVEAGLTPMKALQAATYRAAEMLGADAEFGSVEPGKRADLILLDANPLADIRNTRQIRAVVAEGRLYRRGDLDELLSEVEVLNQPQAHDHSIRIVATDDGYQFPDRLPAGMTHVVFENRGSTIHEAMFVKLPDGRPGTTIWKPSEAESVSRRVQSTTQGRGSRRPARRSRSGWIWIPGTTCSAAGSAKVLGC